MKTVSFDARLIDHPGIGRYIRSLLEAILTEGRNVAFILVGDEAKLAHFKQYPHVKTRHCRIPIYGWSEQWKLHRWFQGSDLVHIPHFNIPLRTPKNLVVTIHDLIYFHERDYEPFPGARLLLSVLFRRIARKARRIITVSRATSRECEERFPSMRSKLKVIHEAADPLFWVKGNPANSLGGRFGFKEPYILYVGSLRSHKNVQGLIEAYVRLLARDGVNADLVLVGPLDPRFDRKFKLHDRMRSIGRIHHLTGVSDTDLRDLYSKAACLVVPSFYEGFGLPALEAMASGTCVISSDAASLPEVVGDAALLFNPSQIDALSDLLYNILSDNGLRQKQIEKGYERARLFSWREAARQTLKVYHEILEV